LMNHKYRPDGGLDIVGFGLLGVESLIISSMLIASVCHMCHTSTGNVRPGTLSSGAIVPSPPVEKYFWNFSASSVADMTTILRSFRRLATSFRRPKIRRLMSYEERSDMTAMVWMTKSGRIRTYP
jgi:hypothetical protein